jgi:arginase
MNSEELKVIIVPAGFSGGQPKRGASKGPESMLERGKLRKRLQLYSQVEVISNIHLEELIDKNRLIEEKEGKPSLVFGKTVSEANEKLFDIICKERKSEFLPNMVVTLGGDHSIAMGSIAATSRFYPDLSVIWIDAHADINTPETTVSGNLHGMPLGFLCNIDNCLEMTREFEWMTKVHSTEQHKKGIKSCLNPSQLAYIGLRDVDKEEYTIIEKYNCIAFHVEDVLSMKIEKVVDTILEKLPKHTPIHLSIDIDALDPEFAPSTGTPVRNGLRLDDVFYVTKAIAQTGRLVAMDLVEVNPEVVSSNGTLEEDAQKTINSACLIIENTIRFMSKAYP